MSELSPEEAAALLDDELTADEALTLLAAEDTGPKRRSKKISTDDRTIQTWIKLQHNITRDCEVRTHDESDRPRNKGVTVIIDDVAVCRICFLLGRDHNA